MFTCKRRSNLVSNYYGASRIRQNCPAQHERPHHTLRMFTTFPLRSERSQRFAPPVLVFTTLRPFATHFPSLLSLLLAGTSPTAGGLIALITMRNVVRAECARRKNTRLKKYNETTEAYLLNVNINYTLL
jgi:hypothetical protein